MKRTDTKQTVLKSRYIHATINNNELEKFTLGNPDNSTHSLNLCDYKGVTQLRMLIEQLEQVLEVVDGHTS